MAYDVVKVLITERNTTELAYDEEAKQTDIISCAGLDMPSNVLIISGSVDPSSGAGIAAGIGSIYLRSNGETWKKTNSANTDWSKLFSGPVSSTDNAVARYDGISGTLVQDSNVLVDDSNSISTTGGLMLGATGAPWEKFTVLNGNILSFSGSEQSFTMKRTGTIGSGHDNPIFVLGRIIDGGLGYPEYRLLYSDDATSERPVFIMGSEGTISAVNDGTRRSQYEGYIQNLDVYPTFRLTSSPDMTLEFGPGGLTNDTDVKLQRNGTNSLKLIIGGSTQIIWYSDREEIQAGTSLVLGQTASGYSDLRFLESSANGTNYVGFKAPASISANQTWTLPAADGTINQVLKTDGSGNLGWSSGGSGYGYYDKIVDTGYYSDLWTALAACTGGERIFVAQNQITSIARTIPIEVEIFFKPVVTVTCDTALSSVIEFTASGIITNNFSLILTHSTGTSAVGFKVSSNKTTHNNISCTLKSPSTGVLTKAFQIASNKVLNYISGTIQDYNTGITTALDDLSASRNNNVFINANPGL